MAFGWEVSELFPEGLILKLLLAGKTLNSFLIDGTLKVHSVWSQNIYPGQGCPVLQDLESSLPGGYSLFLINVASQGDNQRFIVLIWLG